MKLVVLCVGAMAAIGAIAADVWPDGTEIGPWFGKAEPVDVAALGKAYRFDDNGIFPDGKVRTREIQALIDRAAAEGGGVITVTPGVHLTGSLFFRKGVNLRLLEGAVLLGSTDPSDYPTVPTRVEGKCRDFVAALVNAEGCDGFTVVGPGTIDGNGYLAWRRAIALHERVPTAVNLDERRARLLYVAHSKDVRIENVRLQNPQFWTQHFWDCENVRLVGVTVYSPSGPEGHVKSCTDALDLDETHDVLVRSCRFACNDDAIAIKGTDGAAVEHVLIEDCAIGFCHGALVLGSEAKRVRNVLMRRCTMDQAMRVLWIKFRADMKQHYDYVTVEDVKGSSEWFFFARQFSDNRDLRMRLSDEELAARRSVADHFTMRNCRIDCREFFHMTVTPDVGSLADFSFAGLDVRGENVAYDLSGIERCDFSDVKLAERRWTGRRHGVGPVKRPPLSNAADWRTALPRPVFDEKPELVEFYKTAWEIAHTRIDNLPGIPVPRYMDEGHRSDWIWIWDTCFMAHFCKYAPWEFPGIDSLGNFYGLMFPEGELKLPKVIGNRWSCGPSGIDDPWEGKLLDFKLALPDNPPLFAWTEYRHALQTGDRGRLERVYREKRHLQRWFEMFENFTPEDPPRTGVLATPHLRREGDLGYHWDGGRSGMDNTPRGRKGEKDLGPKSPADCPNNPDLLWVDAYSQQALAALYISRIADLLGDADGEAGWRAKYEAKKAKIDELYWDETDGFYYDILASDRSKCKVPTMASYWTLLAEIPDATRRARLVEKLRDENWFGGDVPTPSLARNDADFWPTGGYWRGGVWMPTSYMTIKALDGCGETSLARELAKKIVGSMCDTWKNYEPHTIWEAYSPTEPKPATYAKRKGVTARPDFCGWSALGPISLFIEDVIGVKEANAFTNTLVCDFERNPKGRVGVENYRFGKVTCSIVATKDSISVESDAPFALVVDGRTFQVNAGKSAFVRR